MVDLIHKIPIPSYPMEDSWSWTVRNSGSIFFFFVKLFYWLCREGSPPWNLDYIRGQIWKSKIHECLKMLIWRIIANVLPTKEVISMFNENLDRSCPYIAVILKPYTSIMQYRNISFS